MNWKITEKTTSRNGIQTREEWRDGEYTSWRKHFTVSETERVLVVSGVEILWSRNTTKTYEDGTIDPAYPMQSGFAEIVSVSQEEDGFIQVVYLGWDGEQRDFDYLVAKPNKRTRNTKVAV